MTNKPSIKERYTPLMIAGVAVLAYVLFFWFPDYTWLLFLVLPVVAWVQYGVHGLLLSLVAIALVYVFISLLNISPILVAVLLFVIYIAKETWRMKQGDKRKTPPYQ